jgi:ketosteroid isomerase-like protein
MTMTRRHLAVAGALALGTSALLASRASLAESADEAAVNAAVEALRKAMLAADKAKLEELVADQLSYGHSGGVVETKAQFIDVVAGKKTVYKTITLSAPSVTVAGSNAIARHVFEAEYESNGKPGTAKIGVMQVWTKQGGSWKLLARQAFRLS